MDTDLVVVRNSFVRKYIEEHRAELLDSYNTTLGHMRSLENGEEFGGWKKNSPVSFETTNDFQDNVHLAHIYKRLGECFPDYALLAPELWFCSGNPVSPHNDALLYLVSGSAVLLQAWLLLECMDAEQLKPRTESPKGCINWMVPAVNGPVFPGMDFALTVDGKEEPLPEERVIGDEELQPGDLVIFKNGVIHYKDETEPLFRTALAFRAVLKTELPFDPTYSLKFHAWIKEELPKMSDEKRHTFQRNPYFQRWLDMLDGAEGNAASTDAPIFKRDNNDWDGLVRRLEAIQV